MIEIKTWEQLVSEYNNPNVATNILERWVRVGDVKVAIDALPNPYPGELNLTREENLRWRFGKLIFKNLKEDILNSLFGIGDERIKGYEPKTGERLSTDKCGRMNLYEKTRPFLWNNTLEHHNNMHHNHRPIWNDHKHPLTHRNKNIQQNTPNRQNPRKIQSL
jgi:hypothetical protein